MIPNYLTDVFTEYKNQYTKIFSTIYPAKNGTGFPERNLSVNFIRGYEAARAEDKETIISWYEFQFGTKNNLHMDAILLNKEKDELFIIESKRYSNPEKKIEEVRNDIKRIRSLYDELSNPETNRNRIPLSGQTKIYGVILADAWTASEPKKEIIESYRNKKFCNDYLDIPDLHPEYDVQDFDFKDFNRDSKEDYSLLSFVWKIK